MNNRTIHWHGCRIAGKQASPTVEFFNDAKSFIKRQGQAERLILFLQRRFPNDCPFHLFFSLSFSPNLLGEAVVGEGGGHAVLVV